ncbi:MAG: CotH kinase family protein, partial [Firmicutes bacterium]|nr:CotH kinase family protein [Bacillota bacterium]
MSTSRHINKICAAGIALMLVLTLLFMCGGKLGITASVKTVKYANTIFDNSYVHSIDIVMDDWDSFIAGCENEEYAACTVVIDGKKHSNIAIRAKGNTSLSSVRSSGSERYSFKLEFDHFQDGKSLDGLDKLCLNNLIQDTTMMKDYLVYTMMSDFGVDSPLCSFAYLTVNGE